MILNLGEFTRGGCNAVIVGNVYFQKCRLAAFLSDLIRCFATSLGISRTDKHVKSFGRELSRHFVANAFIRAGNQYSLHVLFIGRVRIVGLQKILQQRLRIRGQFFHFIELFCDRARSHCDLIHVSRSLIELIFYFR